MPFRSLFARLAALILGIMALTVWATISALNYSVSEQFTEVTEETESVRSSASADFARLSRTLAQAGGDLGETASRYRANNAMDADFLLVDESLNPIYATNPLFEKAETSLDANGRASISSRGGLDNRASLEVVTNNVMNIRSEDGSVRAYLIALPPPPPDVDGAAFAERAWTRIALWLGLILLGGMSLSLLVLRWAVRPIDKLTKAALLLNEGRQPDELPVPHVRELEGLFKAFNSATATIARTSELRKQMIADVAHELRTPITNLRSHIEAFDAGLIEDREVLGETLTTEIALLERLIGDFQQLALSESGQLQIRMIALDLAELATSIVAAGAERPDMQVVNNLNAPIPIMGDPDRIQQVLLNLMENAARHRRDGLVVTLDAIGNPTHAGIIFADNGPGIAEGADEKIFQRFYRGDISREQDTAGAGLGLTIARSLMTAMGGSITASPRSSGRSTGAEFHLLFLRAEVDV